MDDWISAAGGNPEFAKYKIQGETGTVTLGYSEAQRFGGPGGNFRIVPLNVLMSYCGAGFRYFNRAPGLQYIAENQNAFPLFSVYPTPPPQSAISLSRTQVEAGESLTVNRTAKMFADYTRAHYEYVFVNGPNELPANQQIKTNLIGKGPDFPLLPMDSGSGAKIFDCGAQFCDGSADPNNPNIFKETIELKTENIWQPGTYTVHFLLYDGVDRKSSSGSNGEVTATFVLSNLPTPPEAGPLEGDDIDPDATGIVQGNSGYNGEPFDVTQGIPSSEVMYARVIGQEYLYRYRFKQKADQKKWTFHYSITYIIPPKDPEPGPDGTTPPPEPPEEVPKDETILVKRNYSYWYIDQLEVYKIQNATVLNYALGPQQKVLLSPIPAYTVSMNAIQYGDENQHLIMSSLSTTATNERPQGTKTLPQGATPPADEGWKAKAEQEIPEITSKNDKLVLTVNGTSVTYMDDKPAKWPATTPEPIAIPDAAPSQSNVLYEGNIVIPRTLANASHTGITGTISYTKVAGSLSETIPTSHTISGFDWVTVHTPVVNTSDSEDDDAHNQMTHATPQLNSFILDRPFTVYMPTTGPHLSIPGYRNRDYLVYTAKRQVRFPFDVFEADGKTLEPAGQWVDVDADAKTFKMPVWVEEGKYTVEFREVAINAASNDAPRQTGANTNLNNYVAYKTIPVEVIGRLYDFRVTDIADYNWQYVFRQKDGVSPSGAKYWIGYQDIDGAKRGNPAPFKLPILPGSSPLKGYDNVAVKTGYHFKFELKTKGNMYSIDDGIRITPRFYYVNRDGTGRVEVDLYYRTNDQQFVQVGSTADQVQRYVVLADPLRNVNPVSISDSAKYMYDHYFTAAYKATTSQALYVDKYLRAAGQKQVVGNFSLLMLTAMQRTFDPPSQYYSTATVDAARQFASVQHWYGDYSLPAAPYAVKKGTPLYQQGALNDSSNVFLRDGYLIVNFNIESIRHQDVNNPYLQYIYGDTENQWRMEGFTPTASDPAGHSFPLYDGDVVFYHADKSSRDDFDAGVPH
ncbi:DUF5704 domain-containing protein [Tumebacillus permanentifrigoris]|nr:DUF5704 domain-containing protein [Tumebacillus permanentifrigoris]